MRALKLIVIVMGVLIFAASGMLIYGLVTRGGKESGSAGTAAPASRSFGTIDAALPPGATIAGVSVDGGRAVVRVQLPGGGEELRVFDLASGAALGVIRLRATP